MPRIEQIFVFAALDKSPDDEGVAAFKTGEGWMPMVGADLKKVDQLRPIAEEIAHKTGKKIRVLKFTLREELEVIEP